MQVLYPNFERSTIVELKNGVALKTEQPEQISKILQTYISTLIN